MRVALVHIERIHLQGAIIGTEAELPFVNEFANEFLTLFARQHRDRKVLNVQLIQEQRSVGEIVPGLTGHWLMVIIYRVKR